MSEPGICFDSCLLACSDERYDDMCDDCYDELVGGAA